ncbi:MAG: hypothetical protein ACOCYE_10860, partial [Pseudomonadota bacterium]
YGISSHNLIIDTWQGAGIAAMIGAILMLSYFLIEIGRIVLDPPPALKVEARQIFIAVAFVMMGTFVVFRHLTVGFGLIDRHEALAAGTFIAWAYRYRTSRAIDAAATVTPATAQSSRSRTLAERARAFRVATGRADT